MAKGQLHRAAGGISNLPTTNRAEPQPQRVKANERVGFRAPFAADPLRLGCAIGARTSVRERQKPKSKLQAPEKLQTANINLGLSVWSLMLGASLDLGAWSFPPPHCYARERSHH